jgi:glutaredoxin
MDFLKRLRGAPAAPAAAPAHSGTPNPAAGTTPASTTTPAPAVHDDRSLRVFTMGPSQEARWTHDLLASKGIEFQEIDASADATLLSWIRQQTGSPEFPQVFIGRNLLGDLGLLRKLDLEGNLDRVLAGLPIVEIASEEEDLRGNSFETVRARLRRGDVLSLTTPEGETFDTWAEIYANPPMVYHRGEPRPIDTLDEVVHEIVALLADSGTDASWGDGD